MKKILTTILAVALAGGAWGATIQVATEADLTTAISSAAAGDTIQLTADVTLSATLAISKSITLDLNGKTLSKTPASTADTTPVIKALSGTVEIKNGSITYDHSTFTGTGSTSKPSVLFVGMNMSNGVYSYGDCNLTLNGVNVSVTFPSGKASMTMVYVESGRLNIVDSNLSATTGASNTKTQYIIYTQTHNQAQVNAYVSISGTSVISANSMPGIHAIWLQKDTDTLVISGDDVTINADATWKLNSYSTYYGYAVNNQSGATCTIEGGNFAGKVWATKGTITVSGGYFSYDQGTSGQKNKVTLAEGYEYRENTDPTTRDDYPYVVAEPLPPPVAQIGSTTYGTLQAAIDAAQDGQTIVLLDDLVQDDGVKLDKAGATVALDLNGKTFTVNKGTSYNSRAVKVLRGTLRVSNGTIVAVGAGTTSGNGTGCYGAFRIEPEGVLYASDLQLYNARPWGLNVKVCGGEAYLSNVAIHSSYGGGIEVTEEDLGNQSKQGLAVLTGCAFDQQGYFDHCSTALSVSGGSRLVVNSGTYASENYALYVFSSGGVIEINGGTFSGNKDGVAVIAAIDTNTYPEYAGGLAISGGKFSGGYSITSPAYMAVAGGTFVADPSAYLAAGYRAVALANDSADYAAGYRYAVGQVAASEPVAQEGATDTSATYVCELVVKDGDAELGTLGGGQSIAVTVGAGDAAGTTLGKLDVGNVLSAALFSAGEDASSVTAVSIQTVVAPQQADAGTLKFEVHPEAVVSVTKNDVTTESAPIELTNDDLADDASFTFDLDVTVLGVEAGDWVKVTHVSDDPATYANEVYTLKAFARDDKVFVTVTTTHFSTFTVEPTSAPPDKYSVQSSNLFGAIKVTGVASNLFVAVPFEGFGGGSVAASNVVHAGGLSDGTKMYVWNPAGGDGGKYDAFVVSGGAWAKATKVTLGVNGQSSVDDPDLGRGVACGTGVILERRNAAGEAAYVYGQVPAAVGQVALGAGQTLLCAASTNALEAVDLNSFVWTGVTASPCNSAGTRVKSYKTGDQVRFFGPDGRLVTYYYFNDKWGPDFRPTDSVSAEVPAGTAFWYWSANGGATLTR